MKPNIMLLVIDSLRSDQFQNAEKTSITPNIDSLVKNGAYFSQAISSADGTILSLNTIINGLFPNSIGTRAQKIQLKETILNLQQAEEQLAKTLSDKYGVGTLDIDTGKITVVEN